MAITFVEQKKKNWILIVVFIVVIIITGLVLWQGYWQKETKPLTEATTELKEIKINWDILKKLEKLSPFIEIEEWTGQVGRVNPFVSY